MALFLLYESASGYALFEAHGLDEIGQNTEAVRNSVSDLNRFGKVVKLCSFNPFTSALDALKQCNAVSEGKQTPLTSHTITPMLRRFCRKSTGAKFISVIVILFCLVDFLFMFWRLLLLVFIAF